MSDPTPSPDGESPTPPTTASEGSAPDRRELLGLASSLAMGTGLIAAYGTFGAYALRYLYPAAPTTTSWRFIAPVNEWAVGKAMEWRAPDGRTVNIVRQGEAGTAADFIALSDVCPHLGCRVHWESQNNRFFCPCHNGAFDAAGKGVSGPPGDANQSLPRYELLVEEGRLFLGLDAQTAARPRDDHDHSAGDGRGGDREDDRGEVAAC